MMCYRSSIYLLSIHISQNLRIVFNISRVPFINAATRNNDWNYIYTTENTSQ
ncbi:unnamed protein product [Brassica rapa subsp. trilocularis]